MDEEFSESAGGLTWTSRTAARKKADRPPDLDFDFGDELAELRAELRGEREKEERLVEEMRRELENSVGTKGLCPFPSNFLRFLQERKEFVRNFEQAVARLCSHSEAVQADAKQLNNSLNLVTNMAEYISGRVAALDQAKGRVVECMQLVNDLLDLRTCAEGVQRAMQAEEFDEAAQHIHRFLALDSAVFRLGDQVGGKEAGQSMKHSYEVLRKAAADLKPIIERKFDEAQAEGDEAKMQRYFKIFPMINEHAAGIQRFGRHLVRGVEQMGEEQFRIMRAGGTDEKRANVLYADTLTNIVEGIARLIESQRALIDNFYGPDKLLDLLEILQVEADRQAARVLDEFVQKRQLDRKAQQVDRTMRSGGKAVEKMDARELDVVLSEVTLMHTRCELYWRFLKRRLGEAPVRALSESGDEPALSPKPEDREVFEFEELNEEERRQAAERAKAQRAARNKKLDALLNRSLLSTKMQEILGKYVLMEQYYMQESVQKAIEMEDVEEGALTSSLLDDAFFIVRKCIRRSITSSSVDCVCAMLNNGCTVLETDFFGHLNRVIKASVLSSRQLMTDPLVQAGYPAVGFAAEAFQTAHTAYSVLQHGKSVAEAGPDTQRAAFLVALNNLRVAAENVAKLKNGLSEEFARHLAHLNKRDMGKLEHSVGQMDDLARRFTHAAQIALGKLVDAAFRSKLKKNAEEYLAVEHELSDEQFAECEAHDPFVNAFIEQLDRLIGSFNNLLEFLGVVAAEACKQWELVIAECAFNNLGALQLDREFRHFSTYLTTIADWSIREKCARLGQVVEKIVNDHLE
ncbi:Component of oligomeric Golgi complex 4 [Aphelenchoides fujianensis]|nr:Component of oligomeric Golgi complex 4 [Aphelenchoides fujianensis]